MKAIAVYNEHPWETAIWFDSKQNTYVLPIKAAIRTKFGMEVNHKIDLEISV